MRHLGRGTLVRAGRVRLTARKIRKWRLLILFIALPFFANGMTLAQCSRPHYREGAVWEWSENRTFMAVSVPLESFAPSKLVCLAQAFKTRFSKQRSIEILIFGSHDAAKQYLPFSDDRVFKKGAKHVGITYWESQLHGYYLYDAEKHEEYVDLRPFGGSGQDADDTRISLPVTQQTHCRYELSGRCLLALATIVYPDATLTKLAGGTVTLSARIGTNGKMTGIRVDDSSGAADQRELLINEAVQNLKTWQFDDAAQPATVRITYSYVIDPTLPVPPGYRRNYEGRLELPNQVLVRGNNLN